MECTPQMEIIKDGQFSFELKTSTLCNHNLGESILDALTTTLMVVDYWTVKDTILPYAICNY